MDIGAARTNEERESTYRFLNDEISEANHFQLEEARGIDTKATLIAGFAAAAVLFLLPAGGSCSGGSRSSCMRVPPASRSRRCGPAAGTS